MISYLSKKRLLYAFLILLMVLGCKSKKMDQQENPIIIASNEIKKEILSPNKTKKLVLSFNQSINPRVTYNYSVIEVKTNKIIKVGSFTGIKVDWNDNTSLKGFLYQGVEVNDASIETSKKYVIIKLVK